MSQKPVKINNWAIVSDPDFDLYKAPELMRQYLEGNVENHPLHDIGKRVITSYIVGKVGNLIKTRSGTLYELGTTLKEYEDTYPNAKERVLDTLPEVGGETN